MTKVSNLSGPALDYAVDLALGKQHEPCRPCYSTNWAQGGPIIDSIKGFEFKQWLEAKAETCCEAHIHNYAGDWVQFGPTPLIAAMRCFVASKLGESINLPEELQ